MKREMIYRLLFLWLLVFASITNAQDVISINGQEKVSLFTDRTMYISGEKIFFSAYLFDPGKEPVHVQSKVLYCELITPEGLRIAGGKYAVNASKSNGCLKIPEDAISGNYYLKTYTKLMRNTGPSAYHYTRLVIINPFKKEVLHSRQADTENPKDNPDNAGQISSAPGMSTDKLTYSGREMVTAHVPGELINMDSLAFSCLSVAPESALLEYPMPGIHDQVKIHPEPFYPEVRGIAISGKLQDKISGKTLPAVKVNLSIIGAKDFMAMRTDSAGRFFFSLPDLAGDWDIFLSSEKEPVYSPVIQVDNDFCPEQLQLPSLPLNLSGPEKKTALDLAVNYQVASVFNKEEIDSVEDNHIDRAPFYGEPTDVLVLDKYIELPTLEEYFNELPTEVKVRKSQDKKYFRFFGDKPEMVIYDPMVLIDFVAVDDIDKILALSPSDISRIELVNAPYIKGQMTFGGIISFISKKNDFAGIDLPSSGTFINYKFFESCPVTLSENPVSTEVPDPRNTVYWNHEGTFKPGNGMDFNFFAPDTPGIYTVLLRGIFKNGQEFRYAARIEIL